MDAKELLGLYFDLNKKLGDVRRSLWLRKKGDWVIKTWGRNG